MKPFSLRIGDRIDLEYNPANKEFVNEIIHRFGVSKSVNEIALSVQCIGNAGKQFELVQFHNSRNIVHVVKGETNQ